MAEKTIFSFVIDADPKYARQGFRLMRSLVRHCGGDAGAIHVQALPEAPAPAREAFTRAGCAVHEIQRFGDLRHCNKAGQMESLLEIECERAILLDCDMLALADVRALVPRDKLAAKVVDYPNPSIDALEEIARRAGMGTRPAVVEVDSGVGETYEGNCNGGFYSIPKALLRTVSEEWRRWIGWLLEHSEPLRREGKEMHVDQVAMWLAIQAKRIPFAALPANVNYYVHMNGGHTTWNPELPIAMLHYHDAMNGEGRIAPGFAVKGAAAEAIAQANREMEETAPGLGWPGVVL